MSNTESMRRWVKTATIEQLESTAKIGYDRLASEKNPMIRSSLRTQLETINSELKKRQMEIVK